MAVTIAMTLALFLQAAAATPKWWCHCYFGLRYGPNCSSWENHLLMKYFRCSKQPCHQRDVSILNSKLVLYCTVLYRNVGSLHWHWHLHLLLAVRFIPFYWIELNWLDDDSRFDSFLHSLDNINVQWLGRWEKMHTHTHTHIRARKHERPYLGNYKYLYIYIILDYEWMNELFGMSSISEINVCGSAFG